MYHAGVMELEGGGREGGEVGGGGELGGGGEEGGGGRRGGEMGGRAEKGGRGIFFFLKVQGLGYFAHESWSVLSHEFWRIRMNCGAFA